MEKLIEEIIKMLMQNGPTGLMLAAACYFIWKLQNRITTITDRLFKVIENNTSAMEALANVERKCLKDEP